MKKTVIAVLLCIPGMFLPIEDAQSYTLDQGTVSLSGSSNIMFRYSSEPRTYNYTLLMQPGYFAADNLEIAALVSGYFDNHHYSRYEIAPFVIYHIPVAETLNFFAGIGAGFSRSRYDHGGVSLEGVAGVESLLGSQVAFQFKAHYKRTSLDEGYKRNRVIDITSQLGLSVYFK